MSKKSVFSSAARIDRPTSLVSRISTAVGRLCGVEFMAKPKRKSCMTGIMIIVASVIRSRVIWMNSLVVIAQKRPKAPPVPSVLIGNYPPTVSSGR